VYRLVGYVQQRADRSVEINRTLRRVHAVVYLEVLTKIEQLGGSVARDGPKGLITINGEFTGSIVIARCLSTRGGGAMRWNLRLDTALRPDITIAVRLSPDNEQPLDYYLLPHIDIKASRLRLAQRNAIFRQSGEKLAQCYRRLLQATGRVVGQARRLAKQIDDGVKRAADIPRQAALDGLRRELQSMVPRVQQVIRQTKARVFAGDTHAEGKIVSLFEPTTEVIRKGKAAKPTEFGKMVKLQEAEDQIAVAYEGSERRPRASDV